MNRIETDSPHGDDDRSLTVGRVGRFVEFKDPLFFVEVAGALKASGAHAKFMMAGDGPLQPAVEKRIADLGLRGDFTLAGWQRNMARVYAQIDVMTLTSHNEGTSVAIIESMATGLPFVALNIGGMPDLMVGSSQKLEGFDVFENGILVYPRDAGVFATAVNMLGQSATVRQRMGRTGSEFAMERFSKERLVGDLENLYQKLAHPDLRRDPAVLYRPASRPQSNPTHHR